MPISHVSPAIALVVGAAVTLVVVLFTGRERQWLAVPLALTALAAAAVAQAGLPAGQQLTFSGTWALDAVTGWATYAILAATALTVVLSPGWMRTDQRHGEYHVMLLLGALGAVMLAGAADLMELVVGVMLSSVTGYTLAAYHRGSALSVEAGMKYFLLGGLTNSLLLVGVVILYGLGGSTVYRTLAAELPAADPVALVAAVGLVGVGLAFKLGAVPAHAWLPDVAEGAPAPAAAFLTVVPKLGALAAAGRLLSILPADVVGWRPLLALLAAATMTLGNLAALWQDDVRRLLGWSSVSQSGYGLMALVAIDRSPLAVPALLTFLLAYAAANVAAFGVVTTLRGRTSLEDYRGLSGAHPWLMVALVVSFLSLVGIPPLAGFTAKLQLFGATIEAGYGWLAVLAVANTVVSLFYYLRVVGVAYLGEPTERMLLLDRWSASATAVATIAVVAVGLVAEPLLDVFSSATLLP